MDILDKIKRDDLSKQDQNIKITLETLYNKQIQNKKKIYDYLDYLVNALNIRNSAGGNLPIGAILEWGGTEIPEDWLLCNGQSLNVEEYSELFKVLGIKYGGNSENNTFNLPQIGGDNSTLNYIIKVKQTQFILNKVIDSLNSNSSNDALSAKQGNILKNLLNEGGVRNYEKLISKPQINNIILSGNRSLEELGICELTEEDIKEIFGEESYE